jgi:hypothetical protein
MSQDTRRKGWMLSRLAAGVMAMALLAASPLGAQVVASRLSADTVPARSRRTHVNVTSSSWSDAHVYVVRDGLATSLGFVTGPGEADLTLPAWLMSGNAEVQLLVLPVGPRDIYLSPPIQLQPGETAHLTIENALPLSHVEVLPDEVAHG